MQIKKRTNSWALYRYHIFVLIGFLTYAQITKLQRIFSLFIFINIVFYAHRLLYNLELSRQQVQSLHRPVQDTVSMLINSNLDWFVEQRYALIQLIILNDSRLVIRCTELISITIVSTNMCSYFIFARSDHFLMSRIQVHKYCKIFALYSYWRPPGCSSSCFWNLYHRAWFSLPLI